MDESNESLVMVYQKSKNDKQRQEAVLKLYDKNMGLLYKIAKKFSGYAELDDLLQEAYFGVQTACEMFDFETGLKFSTYMGLWVKQVMRRYIADCCNNIKIPLNIRSKIYSLRKIENDYLTEFGRKPSEKELMKLLKVSKDQLDKLRESDGLLHIKSFSEEINDEDSITLGDTIQDSRDDIQNIIDIDFDEKLSKVLWSEVDCLGKEESQVYIYRYKDQLSYREISEKMNRTESEIKTIHDKAMRTLRKNPLISSYRDDFIQNHTFIGGSLKSFFNTNMSVTERIAFRLYEGTIKASLNII